MSATDVLRRMLDERGAEWGDDGYPTTCTVWASDGIVWHGLWRDDCIELIAHLTPEQAIAATLGHYNAGRYVGLRQGEYWERTENGDYYCGGCGWKVTDHDSYCPECGGALHEYALGTGTCNVESSIIDTYEYNRWEYELSCGHTIIWEDSEPPRYCPICGRRIEQ